LPGAIHDQELVLEEKRLRDYGTDPARTEQASQDGNEMDEKKGQIAHRRMVAGQGILRNLGRNNNSPDTAQKQPETQASKSAARSAESGGRKPWIKKTPVEVVLEQINKQEQKVQQMEADLTREKREFQKLLKAKEVLEAK